MAGESGAAGTILVADLGGAGVNLGYVADGRPAAYGRVFPTQALRDGDPVLGLAAMVEAAVAESGISPGHVVPRRRASPGPGASWACGGRSWAGRRSSTARRGWSPNTAPGARRPPQAGRRDA